MAEKINKQTYEFNKKICIKETSSIVGPFEGEGPLKSCFDLCLEDDLCSQKSYEAAEALILGESVALVLDKAKMTEKDIDIMIGGDLLNQITATTFAYKNFDVGYWGIYNACSTYTEGLQIAAMGIEAGAFKNVIVSASSHFSTSERQYRTPLELGSQNPVTSQRTVTGGGCCILGEGDGLPRIKRITVGKIVDLEQSDPYDMGAAMAPAAVDTILTHLNNTGTSFRDYDMIITGDLACEGHEIARKMLESYGYSGNNFTDCGKIIYDRANQYVNNGGSGAGCCANVFNGYFYKLLKEKSLCRILFVATGALLSTTSSQQKNNIPCIAHAVEICND